MAGGGGAWKVAYADFVTAMMAFFMVMWIVGQAKPQVKEAVSQYFNDPFHTSPKPTTEGLPPTTRGINMPFQKSSGESMKVPKFTSAPDKKTNKVRGQKNVEPGKMSVFVLHDGKQDRTGTMVLFEELSAELSPEAKDTLRTFAPVLQGNRHKVEIRAHATKKPMPEDSPYTDAWQLCFARCEATKEYLAQLGVEPERMRMSQAGSTEPFTLRADANYKRNSRVEIYMLDEITEDLVGTAAERSEQFQTPVGTETPKAAPDKAAEEAKKRSEAPPTGAALGGTATEGAIAGVTTQGTTVGSVNPSGTTAPAEKPTPNPSGTAKKP